MDAHNQAPPPHVAVDLLPEPTLVAGGVVVVVDVLRMTTTATVLAELGLARLSVVADVARARERARRDGALLLGERGARPPEGFDAGNSPAELTTALARGRAAVLCTTNGSAAVEACAGAEAMLLGCIRNGAAVAGRALELAGGAATRTDTVTLDAAATGPAASGTAAGAQAGAAQAGGSIRLVCAGTEGRVSLDDMAGAGHVAACLTRLAPGAELDDAALACVALAEDADLASVLASSRHGRRLLAAGFEDDLILAARRDVSPWSMERAPGSRDGFLPRAAPA